MRTIVMASVLAFTAAALEQEPAQAQAPAAQAGNVANGRAVFAKAGCETCHGTDARGTAAGPGLAAPTRPLPAFIASVRKPAGTMPAQSTQAVSDQALSDVYAFLRSLPAAAPAGQAPSGSPAGRADNGAVLFAKVGCYQCHANQAQGGINGPRIGPNPIPYARFAAYVRNPPGDMPPYTEKVLSAQDMADIYAFLEGLPRPPAVNTIPQLAP